jgi:hypothetical protein
MQVQYDRSAGKSTAPQEGIELLKGRMAILGLDIPVIERNYGEIFERLKQHCLNCRDRAPCMVDLKRDPTNQAWEGYCPNSEALNALVALTEAID